MGLLLALWSASSGVAHLIEAINVAYDEEERRGFVRRRGLALAATVLGVTVTAVVLTALATVPDLVDTQRQGAGRPIHQTAQLALEQPAGVRRKCAKHTPHRSRTCDGSATSP